MSSPLLHFSRINIRNWRQFSDVDITFHPKLTVITGANGAGKSTILRLLSQHFGWSNNLLATPHIGEAGKKHYLTGLFSWLRREKAAPSFGTIEYSNKQVGQLVVPDVHTGGIQFTVSISNQQAVVGLHINSDRPAQAYQQIGQIPTDAIQTERAYQTYHQEVMNRYHGGHTGFSPTYRMKEALVSMAMFGPGNQYVAPNPELRRMFGDFKVVLSKILPASVGFRDLAVRIPDVILVTETGEFVIDAASGGLMSLIDVAWQLFLFSQGSERFSVTLDEPENHLHPSMQRSLLMSLINAFPQAQFIVATHSPFIVSSVRDSNVYVLGYEESAQFEQTGVRRRIRSYELTHATRAGTAAEILRDVLGVPVTLPIWAEHDLRAITEKFNIGTLTAEAIANLRRQLEDAGLAEYYPEALKMLAEGGA